MAIDADSGFCTDPGPDAASGALNWAENFGVYGLMSLPAVAIAPSSGDVVITGGLDGIVNFGGGNLENSPGFDAAAPGGSSFLAQFDACGSYKWAKAFGNDQGNVTANAVAVDDAGHVVISGAFAGTVSFGGSPLTASGPDEDDMFLAEYDAAGGYLWSKSFSASPGLGPYVTSVAFDQSGNVVVGGVAISGVSLGGPPLTGYFIAKFDQAGNYEWSRAFTEGGAHAAYLGNLTVADDPSGNVVVAGVFTGSTDFGGGILTPPGGGANAFVAKYDASGAYLWSQQYPGAVDAGVSPTLPSSQVSWRGLAVDASGNVFVSGPFVGTVDFGSGPLTATPSPDPEPDTFLAKISPGGSGIWAKEFGGDMGGALLAADGAGGVVLAGTLATSVDFGGGTLTAVHGGSVVIARFDASGTYQWSQVGGSPSTVASSPSGVSASGTSAVVAGTFGGQIPPATLVLGGKTLTAKSYSDVFLASFVP